MILRLEDILGSIKSWRRHLEAQDFFGGFIQIRGETSSSGNFAGIITTT